MKINDKNDLCLVLLIFLLPPKTLIYNSFFFVIGSQTHAQLPSHEVGLVFRFV